MYFFLVLQILRIQELQGGLLPNPDTDTAPPSLCYTTFLPLKTIDLISAKHI